MMEMLENILTKSFCSKLKKIGDKMQDILFPTICKIENNLIQNVVDIITKKFDNIKKVLIISDEYVYKIYGNIPHKKFIEKQIENKLILIEDSTFENAQLIGEEALEGDYDSIVGIGGGKVQDVCKFASSISKKNFFSVPTTLANDGVCSPIAVLRMKNGYTKSIGTKLPLALFIDISIIKSSPVELIKAGIGDILSNYTAIYDWRLAEKNNRDNVNDFSLSISDMAFNVINNISDIDINNDLFIKQLAEAIVLSGIAMNIAGTSRPCSGSEHLFSHTIDRLYPKNNLHGLQVALGAVVSAYLQDRDYKMLIELLKKYEINIKPSNLGLTYNEYENCWKNAKESRKDRYTILDEIKQEILLNKIRKIYDIIEEEF